MKDRVNIIVLALLTAVAVVYGGRKSNVSYPYVDPNVRYLTDRGSYSEDNTVHVDFLRYPVIPESAPVFVDYRLMESEDDNDWQTLIESTFADLTLPYEFTFSNATNYRWIVYTTWTPPPAVVTNGVWHAYWGISPDGSLVPVKTTIREGADIIAPPNLKR